MKRTSIVFILLVVGLSLAFAAGATENKSAPAFPAGRPITMICPWAPGGGSDVGARILAPYLEKRLGTTINIINPTGASGWVGWERMLSGQSDGYTFSMINLPTIFSGYLDPSLGRNKTIDDFQMLANHVTDYNGIGIRTNETRFTDLNSLIAYAKSNPVTMTTTGVGTQQHILILLFNEANGINITSVPGSGFADSFAALKGNHVDAVVGSVGEMRNPAKNGELKPIILFSEDKVDLMPDVPVWNKLGMGKNIVVSSQRAFAVKKGTPPEIVKILSDAMKDAITDPEQIAKMKDLGLQVDYVAPDAFAKHAKSEEAKIAGLAGLMGWKK